MTDSERGRAAWLTPLLGFTAMFVTVGIGFSCGVLVVPVSRDLSTGPGTVSGVFAVTVMVFFLLGAPAGMLADRFGARAVLLGGATALAGGLALTATATSPWMLYAGHGALVGAAMASTFIPLTALVSALPLRRSALAVGVAVSGIGLGTLVMAPVTAALIAAAGWRDTYLGLAVAGPVVVALCALPVARPPARTAPARGDLAALLRSRDHLLMYASQVLLSVAIFTPFAHLPAYGESVGLGPVRAAGLVGILGAASVVGRLALGPVADAAGLFAVYRACFVAIGASFAFWLWPGAGQTALVLHAVVLGVGYGGFVSLLPVVAARGFGTARLGGLLGVLYTSHVIGAGLGPLATGLLVEERGYAPAGWTGLACGLGAAATLGRVGPRVRTAHPERQESPSRR
jgi:predicted MFS family arabinose efflux permease